MEIRKCSLQSGLELMTTRMIDAVLTNCTAEAGVSSPVFRWSAALWAYGHQIAGRCVSRAWSFLHEHWFQHFRFRYSKLLSVNLRRAPLLLDLGSSCSSFRVFEPKKPSSGPEKNHKSCLRNKNILTPTQGSNYLLPPLPLTNRFPGKLLEQCLEHTVTST